MNDFVEGDLVEVQTIFAVFMAVVSGVGLVVWWSLGHRLSVPHVPRSEALKRRVERESRGAPPEVALAQGGALARRRAGPLAALAFVLVVLTRWAYPLFVRMLDDPGNADNYRTLVDGLLAGMVLLLCPFVAGGVLIQLFTEVDAVGIRRPSWAGGTLIPWSAVTEVSFMWTRGTTFLKVRAGRKRVSLPTFQFRNPAALIELIRQHVPPDRLKDI